ncbi:MAG TPA: DinB family protein [Chitinophagaceae bacterium]|nr:DinB family protein [Chitinophagaceae bacterium]
MWEKDGFLKDSVDTNAAMQQLEIYIESLPGKLKRFSSEELLKRSAPGKWSRQEILGHLVDSAINNLKRFTEIQFLPQPYTVISYQQNELVLVNDYQNLPLQHLLDLWQSLNRQIIFVVKAIPIDKLNSPVDPQYESREMKTLGWIICDYVAHMQHHFTQIFPDYLKNKT